MAPIDREIEELEDELGIGTNAEIDELELGMKEGEIDAS